MPSYEWYTEVIIKELSKKQKVAKQLREYRGIHRRLVSLEYTAERKQYQYRSELIYISRWIASTIKGFEKEQRAIKKKIFIAKELIQLKYLRQLEEEARAT